MMDGEVMFMSQTISGQRAAGFILTALLSVPAGSFLFQSRAADDTPPMRMTKDEDHKRTMDQLHITELRRGKAGRDTKDPNFANYDESKANPFPNLPDPLALKNGKKVTTAGRLWSKRRPEIAEDFDREVYGRVPANVPHVKWEVASTTNGKVGDVDVVTKQLVGVVDNSMDPDIEVKIALSLTTPAHAAGPVPVIMQYGGVWADLVAHRRRRLVLRMGRMRSMHPLGGAGLWRLRVVQVPGAEHSAGRAADWVSGVGLRGRPGRIRFWRVAGVMRHSTLAAFRRITAPG